MVVDRRFTILGAGGFIGSRLAAHLRLRGFECLTPERAESLDPGFDYGHLVYCVGLTSDFRARPLDTIEAHVCFLRKILQDNLFTSLTYLSSTRLYIRSADTAESAVLTVDPHDSNDLYNLSKLLGESVCLHCGRSGTRVVRLSNVVGLRQDTDIFIDQLLAEGFSTGSITFRTSPESCKDYIHIDDVVEALVAVALCGEDGIFNIASGESTTNLEIAEAIRRNLGFQYEFEPGSPTVSFEPVRIDRARAALNFSPAPFAEFFPRYLKDYRARLS